MTFFKPEVFRKIFYFNASGSATGSALQPAAASTFVDRATLWAIPQFTLINRVYMLIDTAITGTTDIDVGDADDTDGYLDGSLSLTLGTTGMYGYDAKVAGAYLRVQTAGATDAGDIYVVPTGKFYKVSGKYIAVDITTANTAGAARLVVEGIYFGSYS